MKKTATILALAGLSMASNPEHIHGSFRNRRIADRKPLVDSSAPLYADDEFQILRPDGGSGSSYIPGITNRNPPKPEKWTPPTNPKIWTPPKEDVRLYADDADDEFQILRPDGGSRSTYIPGVTNRNPPKPEKWTLPTNPKVWTKPKEDFRLYADDADDEFQILRPDGGSRSTYIPGVTNRNPPKPEKYTPPTNPKVWTPPKEDFRLYADDADDEFQILRPDGGNSRNIYIPGVTNRNPPKPEKWTVPTNPKVWTKPKEDFRLYADDADDELILLGELLNNN